MTRISSDLQTILPLLVTKLTTTDNLFDPSCVGISLARDEDILKYPPSSRFLIIKPPHFMVDQGLAAGAGRVAMGVDERIEISLFARLALDRQGQDLSYLTDAALGILQCWSEVWESLQLFDPLDGSNNALLREAMRCLDGSRRPRATEAGWGKLESFWELKYTQQLNYTTPRTTPFS